MYLTTLSVAKSTIKERPANILYQKIIQFDYRPEIDYIDRDFEWIPGSCRTSKLGVLLYVIDSFSSKINLDVTHSVVNILKYKLKGYLTKRKMCRIILKTRYHACDSYNSASRIININAPPPWAQGPSSSLEFCAQEMRFDCPETRETLKKILLRILTILCLNFHFEHFIMAKISLANIDFIIQHRLSTS